MRTTKTMMAVLLVISSLLYACQKDLSNSNNSNNSNTNINTPHPARIFLTDHATPIFDSVFIDIQKLEVKLEDDTMGNDGWVTLSIHAGVYNILRLRNGIDTLFGTGILPNGRLRKIRLTLGTRNSAMKNGQSFPLTLKSEDREVVADLNSSNFEIDNNGQLMLWIDFDAAQSIQVDNSGSGNSNGYRLRSHINIFSRSNSGRIEGKVLPIAADALVMAINGTDTAMAVPDDDDGEFKIVGLNAGTYRVFIDGQNGYMDSTINNIIVRRGEDAHIGTINLHH